MTYLPNLSDEPHVAQAFQPVASAAPHVAQAFQPVSSAAPHVAQAFQPVSSARLLSRVRCPVCRAGGFARVSRKSPCPSRAFSIVEVLVSLAILMAGVVAIASFFPMTLRHNQRAMDSSIAAYLAQLKAEEIVRDQNSDPSGENLIDVIRARTKPTDAVTFAPDPRFAYSFSGQSLLNDQEPVSARVIVGYSVTYRPRPPSKVLQKGDTEILFELAFQ